MNTVEIKVSKIYATVTLDQLQAIPNLTVYADSMEFTILAHLRHAQAVIAALVNLGVDL